MIWPKNTWKKKSLLLPQEIIFSAKFLLTDMYIRGLHISEII